ncbi:hypothetical protein V6N11_057618 [Hibiscus sabdariffa]|uniref:Uncharacterized protein n=1 Tax=Hibiscus sabdariffa TaxID=183260 RepID=A0ABR2NHV4_9ROSI
MTQFDSYPNSTAAAGHLSTNVSRIPPPFWCIRSHQFHSSGEFVRKDSEIFYFLDIIFLDAVGVSFFTFRFLL